MLRGHEPQISFVAQLLALGLALAISRLALKSRSAIWMASFLGAFGAMAANLVVDGHGAFLLLVFAAIIYCIAVAGRYDLDRSSGK
jgi:hypothetical protein